MNLSRLQWLGLAALAGACFWVGLKVGSARIEQQHAQALTQAAAAGQVAAKAASQGAHYDQAAATNAPLLAADDAAVQRDRAALARQGRAPAPAPPPAAPAPDPQPVGQPVVVAADPRDALIADQAKDLVDTRAQLATLTLARDAYRAEADAKGQQIAGLQAALAAVPRVRLWGASLVYGTSGTEGLGVVRSLAPIPVDVSISVVKHQLGNGLSTLEAMATATFRF